jgi:hypothetical protein
MTHDLRPTCLAGITGLILSVIQWLIIGVMSWLQPA